MLIIDSDALRRRLIDSQINVADFARVAELPPATVSQLTRSDRRVTFKTLGKIAKALAVDFTELVKGDIVNDQ